MYLLSCLTALHLSILRQVDATPNSKSLFLILRVLSCYASHAYVPAHLLNTLAHATSFVSARDAVIDQRHREPGVSTNVPRQTAHAAAYLECSC
jgi:hypothetical protein